jgi:hypothetical protein
MEASYQVKSLPVNSVRLGETHISFVFLPVTDNAELG